MTEHRLVNGTLTRSASGIAAVCMCGWKSGGHASSLSASSAFQDHQENSQAGDVQTSSTLPKSGRLPSPSDNMKG